MGTILTVNPGSTAVKYALFDRDGTDIERQKFSRKESRDIGADERAWLEQVHTQHKVARIGIRIVHGGDVHGPALVDARVRMTIKDFSRFAPIHNTIALGCIDELRRVFSGIDIVASFDTDFHKTLKREVYSVPIDSTIVHDLQLRRYGFHGLAARSALAQIETQDGTVPSKVIYAHLGGGCSITAIAGGKSIDTTMGLTPVSGLMMITRSGTVEPGIVEYIMSRTGMTISEVLEMLNDKSGFYGMTGSKNTLDIINRAQRHEQPYRLATDIFIYQIVKQIGAYYTVLGGCDMLIFAGGIGYGNAYIRERVLRDISVLGITEEYTRHIQVDEARTLYEDATSV